MLAGGGGLGTGLGGVGRTGNGGAGGVSGGDGADIFVVRLIDG